MKDDRTYKDFGDALYELKKKNYDISYSRIAKKTGLFESTVNALINRRRATSPDDEIIKKMADCFNVAPEYFYEWRLKRFLELVDTNRELLDNCEKEARKFGKSTAPPEPDPEPKKETSKSKKEQNSTQPV